MFRSSPDDSNAVGFRMTPLGGQAVVSIQLLYLSICLPFFSFSITGSLKARKLQDILISFDTYLLSAYYTPGTVQNAGNTREKPGPTVMKLILKNRPEKQRQTNK